MDAPSEVSIFFFNVVPVAVDLAATAAVAAVSVDVDPAAVAVVAAVAAVVPVVVLAAVLVLVVVFADVAVVGRWRVLADERNKRNTSTVREIANGNL